MMLNSSVEAFVPVWIYATRFSFGLVSSGLNLLQDFSVHCFNVCVKASSFGNFNDACVFCVPGMPYWS